MKTKWTVLAAVFYLGNILNGANSAMANEFTVTSRDSQNGMLSPRNFANIVGCTGENISPEISWRDSPKDTKSFVVTIYDPDAPTGSGWWHWVVVDIPGSVTSLSQGAGNSLNKLPSGARQINTDMGVPGYGGACPPVGESHRYIITVKALNVAKLELPPTASAALVGLLSNMHSLAQASLSLKGSR